jgi:DNA-binding response OmpR family regulator
VETEASASEESRQPIANPFGGIRMAKILVIDDDNAVRSVLMILLEQWGHRVVTARDGRSGLAAAERDRFDLLIIDIFMPEMDGFETIRLVRQSKPTLPIIVISGGSRHASEPDFLAMARKLGAIESLHKPFRPDALSAAIEACLGPDAGKAGERRAKGSM